MLIHIDVNNILQWVSLCYMCHISYHVTYYTFIKSIWGSKNLLVTKFVTKHNIYTSKHMLQWERIYKYNMRNVYKQLKINTIISQYNEQWIATKLSNTTFLLLIMALQLFVQSFGLLNQFLPSSSILDKGLAIWHFYLMFSICCVKWIIFNFIVITAEHNKF